MQSTTPDQTNTNGTPGQLWVEPVGNIIVARIRGTPTDELLCECQSRVIALQRDTKCDHILYDALELERPPIESVLTQQALTDELKRAHVKIAIVVPNTGIAYLARLAFGQANHRVFYNDFTSAIFWLKGIEEPSPE